MASSRQLEPSHGEIADWLHHPVTTWFFASLMEAIGGDPNQAWRKAGSWEETQRLKGKAQVLEAMGRLTGND